MDHVDVILECDVVNRGTDVELCRLCGSIGDCTTAVEVEVTCPRAATECDRELALFCEFPPDTDTFRVLGLSSLCGVLGNLFAIDFLNLCTTSGVTLLPLSPCLGGDLEPELAVSELAVDLFMVTELPVLVVVEVHLLGDWGRLGPG